MFDVARTAVPCPGCGIELAPSLLACPSCHALVHRRRLETIARDADSAKASNDYATAIALWREALTLLPPASGQRAAIADRITELTKAIDGEGKKAIAAGPPPGSVWARILGPLGAFGLVLWKIKFLLMVLLTKGKLLLLGLTKATTFFSMLLFLGVYWTMWGWKFALAIVIGIYIHEMGHVAAMKARGIPASAPMFVPGFGAFVRLGVHPATPSEDARIGLAGPLWGAVAAAGAAAVWATNGTPFWAAVAHTLAWINLFNLLPIWQLDGGRGFHALSRPQRWLAAVLVFGAWLWTRDGLLVLIALAAVWRAFERDQEKTPDWTAFAQYALLVVGLSAFFLLPRVNA